MGLPRNVKERIIELLGEEKSISDILMILSKRGIFVTRSGLVKFVKRYRLTGSINHKSGAGAPKKITAAVEKFVENIMKKNDETTLQQLRHLIQQEFGITVSKSAIHKCRINLGWTYRSAAYCQIVREANRVKRYNFAIEHPHFGKDDELIFSDETSCELQCHRLRCARKKGQPPKPKPRAKHPVKVHVWAGISRRGATEVVVFDGIMDRYVYVDILSKSLKPFTEQHFPNGHKFIQDNDPKHTSKYAKGWMEANGINWFPTPPESPDLNPIEMLWHELKEFLRNEKKPKNKQDLIDGIQEFWKCVDAQKCSKYIGHLRKVLPKIVERNGQATGM